jgi:hypothetical protein
VGQSQTCKNLSIEAEKIVGVRNQATTSEDRLRTQSLVNHTRDNILI